MITLKTLVEAQAALQAARSALAEKGPHDTYMQVLDAQAALEYELEILLRTQKIEVTE